MDKCLRKIIDPNEKLKIYYLKFIQNE